MAFIVSKANKIGDWVITKKRHASMAGAFTEGSKVKIIDVDPVRGYAIEDEYGNKMYEIGWEI
jgi:hypothetical protein